MLNKMKDISKFIENKKNKMQSEEERLQKMKDNLDELKNKKVSFVHDKMIRGQKIRINKKQFVIDGLFADIQRKEKELKFYEGEVQELEINKNIE